MGRKKIEGGKLDILKSLKNLGHKAENTIKNVGSEITNASTLGINSAKNALVDSVKSINSYTDTVLHGRNDLPPKVREILSKIGNDLITQLIIDRTPVPSLLTGALNVFSLGKFNKRLSDTPYDKLFHLRLDITVKDNTKVKLEKNEVINMDYNPKQERGSEQLTITNIPSGLTINKMLEGAKQIQGDRFYKYSAYNNNCQDFIMACLKGSGINDENAFSFVKQNTESLFKGDSFLRKIANTTTDLGAKINEITTGTGFHEDTVNEYNKILKHLISHITDKEEKVDKRDFKQAVELINKIQSIKGSGFSPSHQIQSILFDKDKWTNRKAINWLKKHDFDGLLVDEKAGKLRYRQIDPEDLEGYKFITKSIGDNIQFIIAYNNNHKDMKINNNITMKRLSNSSKKREKQIIDKMESLADEIHEHQHMHGGKINIANAFKNLGSKIESGFNKTVNPIVNKAENYITAKQGGLASDLLHTGLPIVTGALGGMAAETLAPEAGPVSGFVGNQAGKYAGNQLADYIGSKTGVGFRKGSKEAKEHMAKIRAMKRR